jgi:alpha-L-rhamnosidase
MRQSAYQIQAASSEALLAAGSADKWDSGKVEQGHSIHISYEGEPLCSEETCFWRVRVWDQDGAQSQWSDTARWTMGLLERAAYKGKWIGPKPLVIEGEEQPDAGAGESGTSGTEPADGALRQPTYLRKEFALDGKIKQAYAHATALGLYELHLNGERVGQQYFAPGFTDYNVRVQVQMYDVTALLGEGLNAVGAVIGDGWYAGTVGFLGDKVYGERPFFLLQLNVEYEDGRRVSVITDASWKAGNGALLYSDFIKGEAYDARLEPEGWSAAGYEDGSWVEPDVRPGYNGLLCATLEPPITVAKTIRPVSIKRTAANTYIYDMGQNMVGWTALTVSGASGTTVTLSHAEMLNPDGTLYLDNLRVAVQQNHYTLKGGKTETYEPHFTFQGFRYVELIGFPGEPDLDTIIGKVIHSDTPERGWLETSSAMVNQLYSNITWGQRGNFLSVPTDCPQRDERLGWTGDAQIFARTAAYNMDVSRFFSKFVQDMIDCQQPSGAFTDVAPDAGWIRYKNWSTRLNWYAPDNAGWGDAGVIIPWTLYLMYGDKQVLAERYDAMVRWVDYLHATTDGLIRPAYANYGDWLSIDADTPNEVLATAYFAYSAKLLAGIAAVLGNQADAERYSELFAGISSAFTSAFVSPEGRIHGETQTVYVLALQFGLLPESLHRLALEHLAADIEARGNRLTTGFLGVGYLLPALTDNGRSDIAYKLLEQESFPSWLYSIKHGATTIWERWDGWTEENGFQTPSMNSFNHYSLGSVGEWMFRYMAGIEADPTDPAFRHHIIKPQPGGTIRHVKAHYSSLYGKVEVEWELDAERNFLLSLKLPANTTADVYLPGSDAPLRVGSGAHRLTAPPA